MLDELESISNDALVAYEEESTTMEGLIGECFGWGDFRTELNPSANDTTRGCGDWRSEAF